MVLGRIFTPLILSEHLTIPRFFRFVPMAGSRLKLLKPEVILGLAAECFSLLD
jgi:hypothetical protein